MMTRKARTYNDYDKSYLIENGFYEIDASDSDKAIKVKLSDYDASYLTEMSYTIDDLIRLLKNQTWLVLNEISDDEFIICKKVKGMTKDFELEMYAIKLPKFKEITRNQLTFTGHLFKKRVYSRKDLKNKIVEVNKLFVNYK